MFRVLCVATLFALSNGAAAKGKVKKDTPAPAPAVPASAPACPRCPTPAPTAAPRFDLEAIVKKMFNYTEAEDFQAAAAMFAPGMVYLTNGQTYDIDLSMPEAVESIPPRWRTNFVWNRLDDNEMWAHAIVTYPDGRTAPEMIIVHVDDNGLIDLFSHVEPKSAVCTAIAPQNFKLALQRVDGTIVDAPQDQLLELLAQQQGDPGYWGEDQYYQDEDNATNAIHTTGNATNTTRATNATATTTNVTVTTNTTQPANATAPKVVGVVQASTTTNTTNTSRPILYIRNATAGKS